MALVVDRLLLFAFMVVTISVTLGVLLHAPFSIDFILGTGPAGVGREAPGVAPSPSTTVEDSRTSEANESQGVNEDGTRT